jgi:lipopolysaccharide/colanic/teichoic acid biosynthesis glycosyltransferase
MGLIVSMLAAILTVFGAVVVKLLADEFKAWAPSLSSTLLEMAVRGLPAELRERFSEEWRGHLSDVPGDISKIVVACGFVLASLDIAQGPLGLRKRSFDLVLSGLGLAAMAPLFIFATILVATSSPGPVFTRRARVGLNGKTFNVLTFRTMYVDADDRLRAHMAANPDAGQEWETTGRMRNDPRFTPVGQILRKSSFDEVPQLVNVLVGDLSIVSPLPSNEARANHSTDRLGILENVTTKHSRPWWSPLHDLKIILAAIGSMILVERSDGSRDVERDFLLGLLVIFPFTVLFALAFLTMILRLFGL